MHKSGESEESVERENNGADLRVFVLTRLFFPTAPFLLLPLVLLFNSIFLHDSWYTP